MSLLSAGERISSGLRWSMVSVGPRLHRVAGIKTTAPGCRPDRRRPASPGAGWPSPSSPASGHLQDDDVIAGCGPTRPLSPRRSPPRRRAKLANRRHHGLPTAHVPKVTACARSPRKKPWSRRARRQDPPPARRRIRPPLRGPLHAPRSPKRTAPGSDFANSNSAASCPTP